MCGIATLFAYHYAAPEINREELRQIKNALVSRGPDGSGEWFSENGRVGLGHRRLAIIDPTPAGTQPMQSGDGKIVISFNGEIYNYRELKSDLENRGITFKSRSDTEVLLHLYQLKGEAMVHDLRGMFAFALWDSRKNKLFLARDPYGIKPLYYADDGWTLRAASQVKALLASEKVSRIPEAAGAVGFFLTGSVPEPFTTYQEIRQVPAGSFIWVDETGPSLPKKYFSIAEVFGRGGVAPLFLQGAETAPLQEGMHTALLDSVRHHFVSDVPVGIFLSSGIDSGALLSLARGAGIQNLQTVTLAFEEFRGGFRDEAPLAEEMANRFGTNHHTKVLSVSEFKEDLSSVFGAMDQPSIDGINTYFVSKAARELGLKVALSGLGGDELFGGYPSFKNIQAMVRMFSFSSKIPLLGEIFQRLFSFFSSPGLNLGHLSRSAGFNLRRINPKYAGLLKYGGTYAGAYFLRRGLFMPWELESVLDKETVREGLSRLNFFRHLEEALLPEPKTSFGRVATLESSFYLRNQLLRDADWAGMAHSLEIRTPFVDATLLKSLVPELTLDRSPGFNPGCQVKTRPASIERHPKRLLLESLRTPLPEKVTRRAKSGFCVPMDRWLENDSGFDEWRRVPSLTQKGIPWARRWAYTVMARQKGSVVKWKN